MMITTILTPDRITFYGRDWKVRLRAKTQGVKAAFAVADTDGGMAFFALRALDGALKRLRATQDGDRVILEYKSVAREFQARPIEALPRAEMLLAHVSFERKEHKAWRTRYPFDAPFVRFELGGALYEVSADFEKWFTPAHSVRLSACGQWAVSTAFRHASGERTTWLGELFAPVKRVGVAY
jgi:hypothetical protein